MVSGLEEDLGSWVEPIKSTKVGLKCPKTSSVTVSVVTPRKCSWVSTSSSSNLGSGMDLDQMDQVDQVDLVNQVDLDQVDLVDLAELVDSEERTLSSRPDFEWVLR